MRKNRFLKSIAYFILISSILLSGCDRNEKYLNKLQIQKLDYNFPDNPFKFTTFSAAQNEFIAFLKDTRVNVYNLNTPNDSFSIKLNFLLSPYLKKRYGDVSSFCLQGRDSLFILTDNALLFFKNKEINKVILINALSKNEVYQNIRFRNLDRSPIYFDAERNRVIGRVYCHVCPQTSKNFYEQPQLAGIDLTDGKLNIFKIPYPSIYRDKYWGFSNTINVSNTGNQSIISYSIDPNFYIYDRRSDHLTTVSADAELEAAKPLSLSEANSTETKTKALTTNPMFTEVRYDPFRKLYYRFVHGPIPLKNKNGTYNVFANKPLILAVYNDRLKLIGQFTLEESYREFISFVGKKGLYIFYRTENNSQYNYGFFKILTFKHEV